MHHLFTKAFLSRGSSSDPKNQSPGTADVAAQQDTPQNTPLTYHHGREDRLGVSFGFARSCDSFGGGLEASV